MPFRPKPSRRVKMTIVITARNDRPNETSKGLRWVALMKRPPVLQRIAAPRTSRSGEEGALAVELNELFIIYHLTFFMVILFFLIAPGFSLLSCAFEMANDKCQMTNGKFSVPLDSADHQILPRPFRRDSPVPLSLHAT